MRSGRLPSLSPLFSVLTTWAGSCPERLLAGSVSIDVGSPGAVKCDEY